MECVDVLLSNQNEIRFDPNFINWDVSKMLGTCLNNCVYQTTTLSTAASESRQVRPEKT